MLDFAPRISERPARLVGLMALPLIRPRQLACGICLHLMSNLGGEKSF